MGLAVLAPPLTATRERRSPFAARAKGCQGVAPGLPDRVRPVHLLGVYIEVEQLHAARCQRPDNSAGVEPIGHEVRALHGAQRQEMVRARPMQRPAHPPPQLSCPHAADAGWATPQSSSSTT
jgi:hypothetical protein